ncbi:response regulator [Priestia koreensis]|uniref:AraC family transcriptional regulator n=1 Tax=Priestia koreensis TaxID=284581 RepID=A0A0M0L5J2_9BACI|nr:response regulator [Priestia koreensis]KOO46341.1 hypothetical protein AMD01_10870 [Priestia koreensis]
MITILIVDDEEIERIALQKIIERNLPNTSVVASAENGREAIEFAMRYKPDLILMDIKMPGINGLEAIKKIKQEVRNARIVIVSSYDTFDYAQSAIRLGVKDYLLKPSKPDVIVETLQGVIDEILVANHAQKEQEKVSNKLKKMLPIMETDLVSQLLFDQVHDVHLEEMLDLLEVSTTTNAFVCLLTLSEDTSEEQYKLYKKVKEMFYLHAKGWIGALSNRQIPLIIFIEEGSFRSNALAVTKKLIDGVKGDLSVGIGNPYVSLHDIHHSYHEAIRSSVRNYPSKKYHFYQDMKEEESVFDDLYANIEKQMFEKMKDNQWSDSKQLIEEAISLCRKHACSILETQQRICSTMMAMKRYMTEIGYPFTAPIVLTGMSYEQIAREASHLMDLLTQSHHILNQQQEHDIAQRMKNYIQEHYYTMISLETMADKFDLTPHYLSKIFKDSFQISYIDYLTKFRIEKAKELMRKTDQSVKEIAIDIGYTDPNYFSRVFKKVCKMSPSQYREQLLKSQH